MRNTADVTSGKTIAVLLQCISGVNAINPLVAFYDIHGGYSDVLFFYFVPDTTQDILSLNFIFKYFFAILCSVSGVNTPEIDYDKTALGLPSITSALFLIAK
jgi:hypothetical protein